MKYLFGLTFLFLLPVFPGMLNAQTETMSTKTTKAGNQSLSAGQQSIVAISALTAKGDLVKLEKAIGSGLDAGLTVNEIKEVLVQLYAYCGFPRSLNGINTLIKVTEERKKKGIKDEIGREASPITATGSKYERGKKNLETLTGRIETGAKTGYAAFSPEIDVFLKEHLFADIFERDVLNYQDREITTISALVSLGGVEPQLMSHLGIGLNVGLTEGQQPATVVITLKADGSAHVASAVTDIGPGTYTVMSLIAAEYLGIPPEKIKTEIGDTRFPRGPVQGGSTMTASIGTAIYGSANSIKGKLLDLAGKDAASPFKTAKPEDLELIDGKLQLKNDSSKSVNIFELMRRNNLSEIVDVYEARPSPERQKYATGAHGAQFVEVKIDPDTGAVRVTRAIEVTACGRIMNPKTSHSQEIGGVVWGIGMALQEETEVDHRYGRIMNPNLQHYHVPVNADILDIETIFVEEDDKIVNPPGIKGMGELGMVGIPAAIANAVFHATGKRIRDLPITPDKLL